MSKWNSEKALQKLLKKADPKKRLREIQERLSRLRSSRGTVTLKG